MCPTSESHQKGNLLKEGSSFFNVTLIFTLVYPLIFKVLPDERGTETHVVL